MIWNGKFTGADMLFIAGALVGISIAALVGWAGILWVARMMVGG